MTIQQAMRQLIVEGLIYTRKGQGTFVRKNFLQLSQWELPGSDYFGATKTREHLGEVQSEVVRFAVRFPATRSKVRCLSTPMPRCMTLFACGCSTASRYRWI